MSDLWTGEETLVPAALRGFRSWRVRDGKLLSTGVAHEWDRPEVSARCLRDAVSGGYDPDCPCDLCLHNTHAAPVKDCGCGIYGWYDPVDSRLVRSDVFGVVEVTGRAVMASHGFRAERARIVALAIEPPTSHYYSRFTLSYDNPPSSEELHGIARWAKTHEIPVFTSRVRMLEEFPPQDVSGLVEHSCDEKCAANEQHGTTSTSATLSASYLNAAMSSALSSPTWAAVNPAIKAPVGCQHKRLHVGLLFLSLVCALINVPASLNGDVLNLALAVANGGWFAYWTRHYLKQHRKPKQTEPAASSDDEGGSW